MRQIATRLRAPALLSALLVLPLLGLELLNRRAAADGFPALLFGLLWLLPLLALLLARPLMSARPAESPATTLRRGLPRLAVALLLGWIWLLIVRDQLPCFLGLPNCD